MYLSIVLLFCSCAHGHIHADRNEVVLEPRAIQFGNETPTAVTHVMQLENGRLNLVATKATRPAKKEPVDMQQAAQLMESGDGAMFQVAGVGADGLVVFTDVVLVDRSLEVFYHDDGSDTVLHLPHACGNTSAPVICPFAICFLRLGRRHK